MPKSVSDIQNPAIRVVLDELIHGDLALEGQDVAEFLKGFGADVSHDPAQIIIKVNDFLYMFNVGTEVRGPMRQTELMQRAALLAGVAWSRISPAATLPSAERSLWESVGADFEDSLSRPAVKAATIAAMDQLRAESVVGNRALAAFLDVGPARISQLVNERAIYSFDAVGDRAFPRWQFVDRSPIAGLRKVLAVLEPKLHPLTVTHWFHATNVDLEVRGEAMSPLEWLASSGPPERVAAIAAEL